MNRTLVLLRHGQTSWNLEERAQGHADISLDDTGRAQASTAAAALAGVGATRLWSSDLSRALETASFVSTATGLPVVSDPRLREYDVGVRSGLTMPEFAEKFPAEYAAWLVEDESLRVAGAESTGEVRSRMSVALAEILDTLGPGETGIVVTHGACLKVGVMALLDWPWELAHTLRGIDNCAWATLTEHAVKGGLRLASYNETAAHGRHPQQPLGADFASDETAR